MRGRTITIGFAAGLALVASIAGPANATPITRATDGANIVAAVFAAPNQEVAYNSLSAKQQATFMAYETPARVVMTVTKLSPAVPHFSASRNLVTAATTSCWTAWATFEMKATAGNTIYTWWQTLNWCTTNGTTISSHSVIDRGGETSTPGWTYSGHGLANYSIVGNQIRQYTQEKFTFSVLWTTFTNTECAQIRGSATGAVTSQNSCNLA